MAATPRKIKAWLVTWDWCGEHAKRPDKIAAILSPRWSSERVRELMKFIYVRSEYTLSEQMEFAKGKMIPHTDWGRSPEGVPWLGEISCGGSNPFLYAFRVDDLSLSVDAEGNETPTWTKRPHPKKVPMEELTREEVRRRLSTGPNRL